jgi:EAL domain-containing protein (putative c-di-GMP-specific phosphodiesterase class I)
MIRLEEDGRTTIFRDASMPERTRRGIAIDDLIDPRYLKPEYQPIFDLASGEQVAAEALARWPDLGVNPEAAFHCAELMGRLDELDEACRKAAIADAVAQDLPPGFELFVNLEPSVLRHDVARRLLKQAGGHFGLVVEITERALATRPAELLRAVRQLRAAGCAIALDDVGAVPEALALLPLIAPDVIKLDISLVQGWPNAEQAGVYATLAAYAERTGATVLAEGIEHKGHLQGALALGATLGQGWYLGRPGPLRALPNPSQGVGRHQPISFVPDNPFTVVDYRSTRIGPKALLDGISQHLERQALAMDIPPVVLASIQDARYFTPKTAMRFSALAIRCPIVVALGAEIASVPVAGVRGIALSRDDPLRRQWTVVVVGVDYMGALIARDMGDIGPERDRRFEFVLSHEFDVVLAAARSLLARTGRG